MIDVAAEVAAAADVFVVVGTSLLVYPAAGLIHVPAAGVPKYLIDPQLPDTGGIPNLTTIEAVASQGLARLRDLLLDPTT
jgi:NAD-dependent deacetylase